MKQEITDLRLKKFPLKLKTQYKILAATNRITLNNLIVQILEDYIKGKIKY